MTLFNPRISSLQEKAFLASCGYSLVNKSRQLLNTATFLGSDVCRMADARVTQVFMQIQAAISSANLTQSFEQIVKEESCVANGLSFEWLSSSLKSSFKLISKHPISVFVRNFCFYKQTTDFSLATIQYLKGNREFKSLVHHGVNTTLAYIPIIASQCFSDKNSSFASAFVINALTISCLFYSLKQDITRSIDKTKREPSPSVALAKRYFFPLANRISSYFYS